MINNWFITGDTHGNYFRFKNWPECNQNNAVIILGDCAFNYLGKGMDEDLKHSVAKYGITFYCVRGNHEMRPEDCNIPLVWDDNVRGEVYVEEEYPYIKYFKDGGEYFINGYSVLVIGGAYSVDKFYRLQTGRRWFESEQLCESEKIEIAKKNIGRHFDIVLSHTCPYSWIPYDLFISGINQATVDNSMELWLDSIKNCITYNYWFFGHFHANRLEKENVCQLYNEIHNIDNLINIMNAGGRYFSKSPNYFMKG